MRAEIPNQKVSYELVSSVGGKEMSRVDLFEDEIELKIETGPDGKMTVEMDEYNWGRRLVAKLREFCDDVERGMEEE